MRPKVEAAHWSQFWPCLHVYPCPGAPPWVCRTQDFMSPQQEQGQVLVMRTHLSLFSTERNTKYIPMKRLQCHLIATDNLIHSAKPTAFLILLGNKFLVEAIYFHLPPKCICQYDGFLIKPYTPSPSQFTSGPGPAGWNLSQGQ